MLPGKTYTPEDVLQILRSRVWLLLVPFALVSAATAVVARQLPDRYRSETLIYVVPQQVPSDYVRPTQTTRIQDRLQSISQQILSRTRLERIIQDFNLYPEERRTGIMEDVVEQMRRDIFSAGTGQVTSADSFRVAYVGSNPRTVKEVTERLASLFIDESNRDRQNIAEGTNEFLETSVADTHRRLLESEKRLEDYKRRFAGELPSQMPGNLQVVQNMEMQIQSLVQSQNHDRERRLDLQRQLDEAERLDDGNALSDAPAGGGTAAQQLQTARNQLAAMQLRLTADHPDIRRAQRVIQELEAKAEREALEAPVTPALDRSPATAGRRSRVAALRADLDQLNRQLAQKEKEESRLRGLVGGYQRRIQASPIRESEMTELTRDYALLQGMYSSLVSKREEAKLATNLERRQIGEQFKLLDPARIAEKPFSPNRERITLMGMAGGLALGIALIFLLEYRDRSFRTDEEIARVLALPVLAVVPLMQSEDERKRLFRRRLMFGCGAGCTVALCFAAVAYTLVR